MYRLEPWRGEPVFFPLRGIDACEVRGLGHDPAESLSLSLLYSVEATLVIDCGAVVGAFGIAENPQCIVPWLLCSPRFNTSVGGKGLIKEARLAIARWRTEWGKPMMNIVWEHNQPSIRFLQHVGFTFPSDAPLHVSPVDPTMRYKEFHHYV